MILGLNLHGFHENGGLEVVVIGSSHELGPQIEAVVGYAKKKFPRKTYRNVIVDGKSTYAMILTKI
jgi:hypothetical protein